MSDKEIYRDQTWPMRQEHSKKERAGSPRTGRRSSREPKVPSQCYFSRELRGRPGLAQQFPFYIQYLEISNGCGGVETGEDTSQKEKIRKPLARTTEKKNSEELEGSEKIIQSNSKEKRESKKKKSGWNKRLLIGLVGAAAVVGIGFAYIFSPNKVDYTKQVDAAQQHEELKKQENKIKAEVYGNRSKNVTKSLYNESIRSHSDKSGIIIQQIDAMTGLQITSGDKDPRESTHLTKRISTYTSAEIDMNQLKENFIQLLREGFTERQNFEENSLELHYIDLFIESITEQGWDIIINWKILALHARLTASGILPVYLMVLGNYLESQHYQRCMAKLREFKLPSELQEHIDNRFTENELYLTQNNNIFYWWLLNTIGSYVGATVPLRENDMNEMFAAELGGNTFCEYSQDDVFCQNIQYDEATWHIGEGDKGSVIVSWHNDGQNSKSLSTEVSSSKPNPPFWDKEWSQAITKRSTRSYQDRAQRVLDVGLGQVQAGKRSQDIAMRLADNMKHKKSRNGALLNQKDLQKSRNSLRVCYDLARNENPEANIELSTREYVAQMVVAHKEQVIKEARAFAKDKTWDDLKDEVQNEHKRAIEKSALQKSILSGVEKIGDLFSSNGKLLKGIGTGLLFFGANVATGGTASLVVGGGLMTAGTGSLVGGMWLDSAGEATEAVAGIAKDKIEQESKYNQQATEDTIELLDELQKNVDDDLVETVSLQHQQRTEDYVPQDFFLLPVPDDGAVALQAVPLTEYVWIPNLNSQCLSCHIEKGNGWQYTDSCQAYCQTALEALVDSPKYITGTDTGASTAFVPLKKQYEVQSKELHMFEQLYPQNPKPKTKISIDGATPTILNQNARNNILLDTSDVLSRPKFFLERTLSLSSSNVETLLLVYQQLRQMYLRGRKPSFLNFLPFSYCVDRLILVFKSDKSPSRGESWKVNVNGIEKEFKSTLDPNELRIRTDLYYGNKRLLFCLLHAPYFKYLKQVFATPKNK